MAGTRDVRAGIRTRYYRRTASANEGQSVQRRLRQGRGIRIEIPPRRHGTRPCVWGGGSQSHADYPSGRDELLRGG